MKYFVFSDVHGCFNELLDSLRQAGYDKNNKEHFLIFLGDAFDKESKNRDDYGLYIFLKENIDNKKLIWVRGNHDDYLLNSFKKNKASDFTESTIRNLSYGLSNKKLDNICDCIKVLKDNRVDEFINNNTVYYYETPNYVFTHGMIPCDKDNYKYLDNWKESDEKTFKKFTNNNGMKFVLHGVKIPNKTLVCGHVCCVYGNVTKLYPDVELDSSKFNSIKNKLRKNFHKDPTPLQTFFGDGVIGLDGNCYDTGICNILVIDD